MRPILSMRDALADVDVFGTVLAGESWASWRVLLIALCGEPLTDDERIIFESLTGRPCEPGRMVEEAFLVIGRRSGKTRAAAILACFLAALCDFDDLAPGERGTVLVLSASLAQAKRAFDYIRGIFSAVPVLRELVVAETADTITLSTGADIEVVPASFRTIRGRTAVAVICDEIAFWRNESNYSANPDSEILAAARPALATTGGPLICISSPYARRGEMWLAYKRDWGPGGDPLILIAKAESRALNPTLPQKVVDRAYERDPLAAAAEYGAEFRSDIDAFVSLEAVEACVSHRVFERGPLPGVRHTAFVDPSGGSADSFTMAVVHRQKDGRVVVDCIRECAPPFSPEKVVSEFSLTLRSYRCATVVGDRYAGAFPRELFQKCGISYMPSERSKFPACRPPR
jgi:Terminase large subunit, T4likevirus-type, N-terminal